MIIGRLKEKILRMSFKAKEGHIPSAFSILDILWVLYDKILKPEDGFILSKGHGCLALYVVLAEKGIIPKEELDTFCEYDSNLGGHPDSNKVNGVLASTGSLGHGLPMAVGMAMAKKIKGEPGKVYCLVGDGECNEGTIWESAMIAVHHELSNLVCIIDNNYSSDRALDMGNLLGKFRSFGWLVQDVNGHDHISLERDLDYYSHTEGHQPMILIAYTIKGKGVKRMQNDPAWHHRTPTEVELNEMIAEL